MLSLGERIKKIRGKKSQGQFAQELGFSKNSLGFYERDERTPNATAIATIVSVCGVSPYWLLMGEGPMYLDNTARQEQTPTQPTSVDYTSLRTECCELRKENSELRQENRELRQENRALFDEVHELRKMEIEYLRLKPEKDSDADTGGLRRSA